VEGVVRELVLELLEAEAVVEVLAVAVAGGLGLWMMSGDQSARAVVRIWTGR